VCPNVARCDWPMHARILQSQPSADRPRDVGRNCSRETAHGRPARITADRSIRTSGGAMTPSETAPLQGAHLIASLLHALWTGPVSPASCGRCHGGDTCLRGYNKLNWPYAGREHHASRNNTTRANSRPCDGHGNARLQPGSAGATTMLLSVQLLHRARRTGSCDAVTQTCFARLLACYRLFALPLKITCD
jgi:hypothetical protein